MWENYLCHCLHPRCAVPFAVKAPCDTSVCKSTHWKAALSTHSPSRWTRCPQRPFLLPLYPCAQLSPTQRGLMSVCKYGQ